MVEMSGRGCVLLRNGGDVCTAAAVNHLLHFLTAGCRLAGGGGREQLGGEDAEWLVFLPPARPPPTPLSPNTRG